MNGKTLVDEEDVMIKKQKGQSMNDAELIRGVVIDKTRVHEGMPKKIVKAKVALIATPLEITKTQVKAKIKISTADQINAFSEQEREALKKLADTDHRQWRKRSPLPERHLGHHPVLSCQGRCILQSKTYPRRI